MRHSHCEPCRSQNLRWYYLFWVWSEKNSWARTVSAISKPMFCQTCGLRGGRLPRKDGTRENDENDKDASDSYKQRVECWTSGNHGNHGNVENYRNPGCKPRVPQTTGLEILCRQRGACRTASWRHYWFRIICIEIFYFPSDLIRGVLNQNRRVTGRDAIVHKRQRSNSFHKELVVKHFPLFFQGFEVQLVRNSLQWSGWTIAQLLRLFSRPL